MFFSIKMMVITAGILSVLGGGATIYINHLQNKNEELLIENELKNERIKLQQEVIERIESDKEKADSILNETQNKLNASRENYNELQSKFNKISINFGSRDIGKLAEAKPGLIQNIVVKATVDVNRCFEILSGKPLTEREINATKPSEINSSCPAIANPNYKVE